MADIFDSRHMMDFYFTCRLCPRECGVDRVNGSTGYCGETAVMRIATACLHFGEEPVLTGSGGSGTVFFCGCTLRCGFCQNHQISGKTGTRHTCITKVTEEECAGILMRLQERGAANINLVTGTHFIPGIVSSLSLARERGLSIPVLWNTSGYESVAALRLLDPYIDVFLPDLKTLDSALSMRIFGVSDYPEHARRAIEWMADRRDYRIEGELLTRGVIVRHLVLPGGVKDSRKVLAWLHGNVLDRARLSLMFQFIPLLGTEERGGAGEWTSLQEEGSGANFHRYMTEGEYADVMDYLDTLGIEEGFVQEPVMESSWLPDFNRVNPFPRGCAVPVWHHAHGFL